MQLISISMPLTSHHEAAEQKATALRLLACAGAGEAPTAPDHQSEPSAHPIRCPTRPKSVGMCPVDTCWPYGAIWGQFGARLKALPSFWLAESPRIPETPGLPQCRMQLPLPAAVYAFAGAAAARRCVRNALAAPPQGAADTAATCLGLRCSGCI